MSQKSRTLELWDNSKSMMSSRRVSRNLLYLARCSGVPFLLRYSMSSSNFLSSFSLAPSPSFFDRHAMTMVRRVHGTYRHGKLSPGVAEAWGSESTGCSEPKKLERRRWQMPNPTPLEIFVKKSDRDICKGYPFAPVTTIIGWDSLEDIAVLCVCEVATRFV